MISLAGGDWSAALLPEQGAALARIDWRGRPVVVPLPPGADPNTSCAGGFLMAPWANRLDHGRIAPGLALPVNRPADDTAIHGLVRDRPWQVVDIAADRAVLVQQGEAVGVPWCWSARLTVGLGVAGFALTLALCNAGAEAFPFGSGWHPFFARPPGTRLRFAATTRCRHDARGLPIATEPSTGIAGPETAFAGLDTAFAGWDGLVELQRPDMTLRLDAVGAWTHALQIFAPPDADFICVEPVSHLPDAPNRPWLGAMPRLNPGASLLGGVRLSAS